MGLRDITDKIYNKITEFKVVRVCLYVVLISYISLLVAGVILANVSNPPYTIWTDWISALGDYKDTDFYYLYDIACIIAGSLTVPFTLHLEKYLAPDSSSRMRIRLATLGMLFGLIGNIGYIFVGIFSEGRSVPFEGGSLHGLFSGVTFSGFVLSAMFYAVIIIAYNTKIPKALGVYGLIGPFTVFLLNILGEPLLEWLLLFSILGWIMPLALILIHHGPE